MLLGYPWLYNTKVTHDWGNNMITIKGNGIMHTIVVTKHFDGNTKRPLIFLYYNSIDGIMDEEKDVFLATNPCFSTIWTITLPKPTIITTTVISLDSCMKNLTFDFFHILSEI
jgi:hypothetical protein